MEGGNALVDAITGKVNPSGKMPFTTPVALEQSPDVALGNFRGRDLKVKYEEDILVGYRWYDTETVTGCLSLRIWIVLYGLFFCRFIYR